MTGVSAALPALAGNPYSIRVNIGPENIRCSVVLRRRTDCVVRVKDIGRTDGAKRTDGATQIHVIARDQESATSSPEPQNPGAIGLMQHPYRLRRAIARRTRAVERG